MENSELNVHRLETRLNEICLEDQVARQQHDDSGTPAVEKKWDLPLKELYRLALSFYREKSGKAIHLSYDDNVKLVAFTQQAIHGTFDSKNAPQLGVLDVIGRDRQLAWQQLGSISKSNAMESFIDLLERLCTSFRPYVEAIKKSKEQELLQKLEDDRRQKEAREMELHHKVEKEKLDEIKYREEMQRRQLQDALNQQTFHQFKAYAERQFPGNPEQQAVLVRQLQNEHYHQYMQQIHAQLRTAAAHDESNQTKIASVEEIALEQFIEKDGKRNDVSGLVDSDLTTAEKQRCESEEESEECLVICPAKMWTRPDIKPFKEEVAAGRGDGVIRVGHGDTVTVRVPTHEGGTCLFWEFATDSYDIGFGVYFEWGKSPTNEVTVHISESDEDDELYDEDDGDEVSTTGDLECGPVQTIQRSTGDDSGTRNPISIIVPVYRRECQNEVYVGSHAYPGEGVYLLKFDNSFSIWRSKTLYYRVYYER